jgi:membrane protein DedA with SNARE-associated domain/membrane-associated phospholipid phosphatase
VKPVWLVGAVALAVFLYLRRRRLEPTLLAGGAIAVVAMAVYGSGAVHPPNLQTLLEDLGKTLGHWTYLLVGVMAFFETGAFVGLIAPGETVMLVGGLVAGQGQIDVLTLIAIAWACAVLGDVTSLFLGRRLGRRFLVKHGPKVSISEERLRQVEVFFDRHGGKAILIGRFVGLVRAIAPFLAGSSGMTLRRFLPYDVIGAGLWSSSFILLGYIFWASFDRVVHYAERGALALGTTIAVIVALVVAVRWLRDEANRERLRAFVAAQERKPLLRPVFAVARPVARAVKGPAMFAWNRLTPGQLGLELTTLLAVLSVAAFAFVSSAVRIHDGPFAPGDQDSLRLADDLYDATLVSVAKVISALGSLPAVATAVGVTAVFCLWRRDLLRAAVLVGGLALTYVAVHVAKDAFDRPRPPRSLIETAGASYPSGHAAYAVAWVAVAVVLTRALPTAAARFAFVTFAVILAVLVGLSRIYLRAHYLSDVMGGWGLGAGIFSVLGIGALIVDHLRHNAREQVRQ